MKLIYIVNRIDGAGGLERVLSVKASKLADDYNYDVTILTLNQSNKVLFYDFSPKIKFRNIMVSGKSIMYLIQYRRELKKVLIQIRPDIISVCDDGIKAFLLPYMVSSHIMVYERHASKNIHIKKPQLNYFEKLRLKLLNKFMHFGGNKYDAFVVLTKANKMEWKLNNLRVIPNPLSFYPKIDKVSTLTNKKVIAVGNHGYQKGYDRLLKSWQIVSKKHPTWVLEIYGKLDTEKKHIKLAERLGISNNVLFYPPVKDIASKYKEASIYVMSSRSEGFGMVLIEAMAHGIPCVSFDCPSGPSDIINHQRNGLLVENGNIHQLALALSDLIKDKQKREIMGKNARIDVKHYLPNKIAEQWDGLFRFLKKSIN